MLWALALCLGTHAYARFPYAAVRAHLELPPIALTELRERSGEERRGVVVPFWVPSHVVCASTDAGMHFFVCDAQNGLRRCHWAEAMTDDEKLDVLAHLVRWLNDVGLNLIVRLNNDHDTLLFYEACYEVARVEAGLAGGAAEGNGEATGESADEGDV